MIEENFTRGPWKLNYLNELFGIDGYRVRVAGYGIEPASFPPTEEECANAHLIAAAPELYEALKSLHQWVKAENEHFDENLPDDFIWNAVKTALAKAVPHA
jgi:hypothetical protein